MCCGAQSVSWCQMWIMVITAEHSGLTAREQATCPAYQTRSSTVLHFKSFIEDCEVDTVWSSQVKGLHTRTLYRSVTRRRFLSISSQVCRTCCLLCDFCVTCNICCCYLSQDVSVKEIFNFSQTTSRLNEAIVVIVTKIPENILFQSVSLHERFVCSSECGCLSAFPERRCCQHQSFRQMPRNDMFTFGRQRPLQVALIMTLRWEDSLHPHSPGEADQLNKPHGTRQ